MIYEQRSLGNERVDTVRIPLVVTQELLDAHPAGDYTEVLEAFLVLYKKPKAEVLQSKIESIADVLPDEIAVQHADIYPTLQGGGALIKAGKRIRVGDALYRASVDLWDNAESTPEAAPNLWAQIILQGEYRIIPDVITAELAFAKDEIGVWKGKNYRAKRDGVVHNPEVYPNDWEEV